MSRRVSSTAVSSTGEDRRPGLGKREPTNLLLFPNSGTRMYWPKSDGSLIFRPFPVFDEDDPTKWAPYHNEYGGFDFIRRYDVVRMLGPEKLSFVINDCENPSPEWDGDADKNMNPVYLLVSRVGNRVSSGDFPSSWRLRTQMQRKADFPDYQYIGISDSYMIQGLVVENGQERMMSSYGLGSLDSTPVIDMDDNCGRALLELLRMTDASGTWMSDLLLNFEAGGFIAVRPGQSNGRNIYYPELLWNHPKENPELLTRSEQVVPHIRQWKDIVYTPTAVEQIQLICKSKVAASAIVYCLEDPYKADIPSYIYEQARAERPVVSVPNNVAIGPPRMPPPLPAGPSMSPTVPAGPTSGPPVFSQTQMSRPTAVTGASIIQPPPGKSSTTPPAGPPANVLSTSGARDVTAATPSLGTFRAPAVMTEMLQAGPVIPAGPPFSSEASQPVLVKSEASNAIDASQLSFTTADRAAAAKLALEKMRRI